MGRFRAGPPLGPPLIPTVCSHHANSLADLVYRAVDSRTPLVNVLTVAAVLKANTSTVPRYERAALNILERSGIAIVYAR
jgi:hypothetical protein